MATPVSPFADSHLFEDGSPKPQVSMRNVHIAQHRQAVIDEEASQHTANVIEQRRLTEANQRYIDIQRAESELSFLRRQQREQAHAAGDDGKARLRDAFIESVRKQAEAAGIEFVEPTAEVIPEPVPVGQRLKADGGPAYDGGALVNIRERFVAAVLAEQAN